MEMELSNIFKTTNVKKFNKVIQERFHKVLRVTFTEDLLYRGPIVKSKTRLLY